MLFKDAERSGVGVPFTGQAGLYLMVSDRIYHPAFPAQSSWNQSLITRPNDLRQVLAESRHFETVSFCDRQRQFLAQLKGTTPSRYETTDLCGSVQHRPKEVGD
jgi:hypothetical protein